MMSLTFGLFTQVSGSGPLGPLVSSPGRSPGRAIVLPRSIEIGSILKEKKIAP